MKTFRRVSQSAVRAWEIILPGFSKLALPGTSLFLATFNICLSQWDPFWHRRLFQTLSCVSKLRFPFLSRSFLFILEIIWQLNVPLEAIRTLKLKLSSKRSISFQPRPPKIWTRYQEGWSLNRSLPFGWKLNFHHFNIGCCVANFILPQQGLQWSSWWIYGHLRSLSHYLIICVVQPGVWNFDWSQKLLAFKFRYIFRGAWQHIKKNDVGLCLYTELCMSKLNRKREKNFQLRTSFDPCQT